MVLNIDISPLKEKIEPFILCNYRVELSFPEDNIETCVVDTGLKIINIEEEGLYLSGKLKINLKLLCSRCIEEFLYSGEIKIEDLCEYHEEDPCDNYFINEDIFNLREFLRQRIFLFLPAKPLCISKCKGLCPDCGTNLNREQCQCKMFQPDDRWLKLKEEF